MKQRTSVLDSPTQELALPQIGVFSILDYRAISRKGTDYYVYLLKMLEEERHVPLRNPDGSDGTQLKLVLRSVQNGRLAVSIDSPHTTEMAPRKGYATYSRSADFSCSQGECKGSQRWAYFEKRPEAEADFIKLVRNPRTRLPK